MTIIYRFKVSEEVNDAVCDLINPDMPTVNDVIIGLLKTRDLALPIFFERQQLRKERDEARAEAIALRDTIAKAVTLFELGGFPLPASIYREVLAHPNIGAALLKELKLLRAVAEAARDNSTGCAPWDGLPCGACASCKLRDALAILHAAFPPKTKEVGA